MAIILNIDTATANASVCLSDGEKMLALETSVEQKNHASFLQPAIARICQETQTKLSDIAAVAITSGPGSYTGLRVGMASAKGICYALNIPLITVNTLDVIAIGAFTNFLTKEPKKETLVICPMIDARRMEVFTALYSTDLKELTPSHAKILDENSFSEEMENQPLLFCGDGASKFQAICINKKAVFSTYQYLATDLAILSSKLFELRSFADLAYSQPNYLKDFYHPLSKK